MKAGLFFYSNNLSDKKVKLNTNDFIAKFLPTSFEKIYANKNLGQNWVFLQVIWKTKNFLVFDSTFMLVLELEIYLI